MANLSSPTYDFVREVMPESSCNLTVYDIWLIVEGGQKKNEVEGNGFDGLDSK